MAHGLHSRDRLAPPIPIGRKAVIRALVCVFATLGCVVFSCERAYAHEGAAADQVTSQSATIQQGGLLFRSNCSICHGANARGGGKGPDLTTGRWVHGGSDADIFHTIAQGVPGTAMPANDLEEAEIRAIVSYLRSLAPDRHAVGSGDPVKGARIFFGSGGCNACHMVTGKGGVLGPDLSDVGASRAASYLVESIREPDKELTEGMADPNDLYNVPLRYDTVTVILADGRSLVGVAKNEDTFSIQLMDTGGTVHLLLKRDLESVRHEPRSLMPPYPPSRLGARDLADLVSYLEGLRGR
ncbi:MAG: c-type cytochrome [Proteobacteria bacterium]|nr:c-type cytochrome [Pseudomonadota bacterium]